MISIKLYVLLFYSVCTSISNFIPGDDHSLVTSISDNPIWMKIFQSVDEATNDEHLLDVTLKLLKSLCVCMSETLKENEQNVFTGDNNYLQLEDKSQSSSKDVLDLYTKMYNSTCFDLRQDLVRKINKMHEIIENDNDSEMIMKSKCGKEIKITTDKVNQMSTHLKPVIRDELRSELTSILFKAFIKTKTYHKYKIKTSSLLKNSQPATATDIPRNVIIIFTLYPINETANLSREITDSELNSTLYKHSPIDIDILETKYKDDKKVKPTLNITTDCQLRSIHYFLLECEKNNSIKVFKLLRKKDTIKIYIQLTTLKDYTDYSRMCCGETSDDLCRSLTTYKKELRKSNKDQLLETISKIKSIVKMYNIKTMNMKDNSASTDPVQYVQSTMQINRQPLDSNEVEKVEFSIDSTTMPETSTWKTVIQNLISKIDDQFNKFEHTNKDVTNTLTTTNTSPSSTFYEKLNSVEFGRTMKSPNHNKHILLNKDSDSDTNTKHLKNREKISYILRKFEPTINEYQKIIKIQNNSDIQILEKSVGMTQSDFKPTKNEQNTDDTQSEVSVSKISNDNDIETVTEYSTTIQVLEKTPSDVINFISLAALTVMKSNAIIPHNVYSKKAVKKPLQIPEQKSNISQTLHKTNLANKYEKNEDIYYYGKNTEFEGSNFTETSSSTDKKNSTIFGKLILVKLNTTNTGILSKDKNKETRNMSSDDSWKKGSSKKSSDEAQKTEIRGKLNKTVINSVNRTGYTSLLGNMSEINIDLYPSSHSPNKQKTKRLVDNKSVEYSESDNNKTITKTIYDNSNKLQDETETPIFSNELKNLHEYFSSNYLKTSEQNTPLNIRTQTADQKMSLNETVSQYEFETSIFSTTEDNTKDVETLSKAQTLTDRFRESNTLSHPEINNIYKKQYLPTTLESSLLRSIFPQNTDSTTKMTSKDLNDDKNNFTKYLIIHILNQENEKTVKDILSGIRTSPEESREIASSNNLPEKEVLDASILLKNAIKKENSKDLTQTNTGILFKTYPKKLNVYKPLYKNDSSEDFHDSTKPSVTTKLNSINNIIENKMSVLSLTEELQNNFLHSKSEPTEPSTKNKTSFSENNAYLKFKKTDNYMITQNIPPVTQIIETKTEKLTLKTVKCQSKGIDCIETSNQINNNNEEILMSTLDNNNEKNNTSSIEMNHNESTFTNEIEVEKKILSSVSTNQFKPFYGSFSKNRFATSDYKYHTSPFKLEDITKQLSSPFELENMNDKNLRETTSMFTMFKAPSDNYSEGSLEMLEKKANMDEKTLTSELTNKQIKSIDDSICLSFKSDRKSHTDALHLQDVTKQISSASGIKYNSAVDEITDENLRLTTSMITNFKGSNNDYSGGSQGIIERNAKTNKKTLTPEIIVKQNRSLDDNISKILSSKSDNIYHTYAFNLHDATKQVDSASGIKYNSTIDTTTDKNLRETNSIQGANDDYSNVSSRILKSKAKANKKATTSRITDNQIKYFDDSISKSLSSNLDNKYHTSALNLQDVTKQISSAPGKYNPAVGETTNENLRVTTSMITTFKGSNYDHSDGSPSIIERNAKTHTKILTPEIIVSQNKSLDYNISKSLSSKSDRIYHTSALNFLDVTKQVYSASRIKYNSTIDKITDKNLRETSVKVLNDDYSNGSPGVLKRKAKANKEATILRVTDNQIKSIDHSTSKSLSSNSDNKHHTITLNLQDVTKLISSASGSIYNSAVDEITNKNVRNFATMIKTIKGLNYEYSDGFPGIFERTTMMNKKTSIGLTSEIIDNQFKSLDDSISNSISSKSDMRYHTSDLNSQNISKQIILAYGTNDNVLVDKVTGENVKRNTSMYTSSKALINDYSDSSSDILEQNVTTDKKASISEVIDNQTKSVDDSISRSLSFKSKTQYHPSDSNFHDASMMKLMSSGSGIKYNFAVNEMSNAIPKETTSMFTTFKSSCDYNSYSSSRIIKSEAKTNKKALTSDLNEENTKLSSAMEYENSHIESVIKKESELTHYATTTTGDYNTVKVLESINREPSITTNQSINLIVTKIYPENYSQVPRFIELTSRNETKPVYMATEPEENTIDRNYENQITGSDLVQSSIDSSIITKTTNHLKKHFVKLNKEEKKHSKEFYQSMFTLKTTKNPKINRIPYLLTTLVTRNEPNKLQILPISTMDRTTKMESNQHTIPYLTILSHTNPIYLGNDKNFNDSNITTKRKLSKHFFYETNENTDASIENQLTTPEVKSEFMKSERNVDPSINLFQQKIKAQTLQASANTERVSRVIRGSTFVNNASTLINNIAQTNFQVYTTQTSVNGFDPTFQNIYFTDVEPNSEYETSLKITPKLEKKIETFKLFKIRPKNLIKNNTERKTIEFSTDPITTRLTDSTFKNNKLNIFLSKQKAKLTPVSTFTTAVNTFHRSLNSGLNRSALQTIQLSKSRIENKEMSSTANRIYTINGMNKSDKRASTAKAAILLKLIVGDEKPNSVRNETGIPRANRITANPKHKRNNDKDNFVKVEHENISVVANNKNMNLIDKTPTILTQPSQDLLQPTKAEANKSVSYQFKSDSIKSIQTTVSTLWQVNKAKYSEINSTKITSGTMTYAPIFTNILPSSKIYNHIKKIVETTKKDVKTQAELGNIISTKRKVASMPNNFINDDYNAVRTQAISLLSEKFKIYPDLNYKMGNGMITVDENTIKYSDKDDLSKIVTLMVRNDLKSNDSAHFIKKILTAVEDLTTTSDGGIIRKAKNHKNNMINYLFNNITHSSSQRTEKENKTTKETIFITNMSTTKIPLLRIFNPMKPNVQNIQTSKDEIPTPTFNDKVTEKNKLNILKHLKRKNNGSHITKIGTLHGIDITTKVMTDMLKNDSKILRHNSLISENEVRRKYATKLTIGFTPTSKINVISTKKIREAAESNKITTFSTYSVITMDRKMLDTHKFSEGIPKSISNIPSPRTDRDVFEKFQASHTTPLYIETKITQPSLGELFDTESHFGYKDTTTIKYEQKNNNASKANLLASPYKLTHNNSARLPYYIKGHRSKVNSKISATVKDEKPKKRKFSIHNVNKTHLKGIKRTKTPPFTIFGSSNVPNTNNKTEKLTTIGTTPQTSKKFTILPIFIIEKTHKTSIPTKKLTLFEIYNKSASLNGQTKNINNSKNEHTKISKLVKTDKTLLGSKSNSHSIEDEITSENRLYTTWASSILDSASQILYEDINNQDVKPKYNVSKMTNIPMIKKAQFTKAPLLTTIENLDSMFKFSIYKHINNKKKGATTTSQQKNYELNLYIRDNNSHLKKSLYTLPVTIENMKHSHKISSTYSLPSIEKNTQRDVTKLSNTMDDNNKINVGPQIISNESSHFNTINNTHKNKVKIKSDYFEKTDNIVKLNMSVSETTNLDFFISNLMKPQVSGSENARNSVYPITTKSFNESKANNKMYFLPNVAESTIDDKMGDLFITMPITFQDNTSTTMTPAANIWPYNLNTQVKVNKVIENFRGEFNKRGTFTADNPYQQNSTIRTFTHSLNNFDMTSIHSETSNSYGRINSEYLNSIYKDKKITTNDGKLQNYLAKNTSAKIINTKTSQGFNRNISQVIQVLKTILSNSQPHYTGNISTSPLEYPISETQPQEFELDGLRATLKTGIPSISSRPEMTDNRNLSTNNTESTSPFIDSFTSSALFLQKKTRTSLYDYTLLLDNEKSLLEDTAKTDISSHFTFDNTNKISAVIINETDKVIFDNLSNLFPPRQSKRTGFVLKGRKFDNIQAVKKKILMSDEAAQYERVLPKPDNKSVHNVEVGKSPILIMTEKYVNMKDEGSSTNNILISTKYDNGVPTNISESHIIDMTSSKSEILKKKNVTRSLLTTTEKTTKQIFTFNANILTGVESRTIQNSSQRSNIENVLTRRHNSYVSSSYNSLNPSTFKYVNGTLTQNNIPKTVKYNTYQPTTPEDFEIVSNLDERISLFNKNLQSFKEKITETPLKVKNTTICSYLGDLRLHINQSIKKFNEVVKSYNCSEESITTIKSILKKSTTDKSRKMLNLGKKIKQLTNKNTLLDPFAKTNINPIKTAPPKKPKIIKTVRLSKTKEIMTMNTKEFFANRRFATQRVPLYNQYKLLQPFKYRTPTSPRQYVLRPKFDPIDQGISRQRKYKTLNEDNFYENYFMNRRAAKLSWKDKVNFAHQVFETPVTHKLIKPIESVLVRPGALQPTEPRYLRDRVNYIRNFLRPIVVESTTRAIWNPTYLIDSDEIDREDKVDFVPQVFETPVTHKPVKQIESVIVNPGALQPTEPRYLRNRVNYRRNFLRPIVVESTTRAIWNPTSLIDSDEIHREFDEEFPYKQSEREELTTAKARLMPFKGTTTKKPRRTRPRKVLHFYSPTAPYSRYFSDFLI